MNATKLSKRWSTVELYRTVRFLSGIILPQPSKAFSHELNLSEITPQVVVPTTLARRYPETLRNESFSSFQSAQVNHGSQL
jgi:hypothetical protein